LPAVRAAGAPATNAKTVGSGDPAKAPADVPTGDAAPVPEGTTWGDVKQRFSAWLSESKANTYPNASVNAVFQADVGFFSQDEESVLAHGHLQDGADFRRARLTAKPR
jgi:hypothetical protein